MPSYGHIMTDTPNPSVRAWYRNLNKIRTASSLKYLKFRYPFSKVCVRGLYPTHSFCYYKKHFKPPKIWIRWITFDKFIIITLQRSPLLRHGATIALQTLSIPGNDLFLQAILSERNAQSIVNYVISLCIDFVSKHCRFISLDFFYKIRTRTRPYQEVHVQNIFK